MKLKLALVACTMLAATPSLAAAHSVSVYRTPPHERGYDQTTFYEAWRMIIQRYGI